MFNIIKGNKLNPKYLILCDPHTTPSSIYKSDASKLLVDSLGKVIDFKQCVFVSSCPKIPDTCKGSVSRTNKHILSYHDNFINIRNHFKTVEFYITLGKSALVQYLGKNIDLSKVRGSLHELVIGESNKLKYFCLYSPNNVLLRPEVLSTYESDLKTLSSCISNNYEVVGKSKNYEWCLDLQFLLDNPPKALAVDTEGTGLRWYMDDVDCLVVQLTYKQDHALVIPVHCGYYPKLSIAQRKILIEQLKVLLENPNIEKSGHNFKYDIHMLREKLGIHVQSWKYDTMQMAFALNENMKQKSLNECVRVWLPEMAGFNDILERKIDKSKMIEVDHDDMLMYAGGDTDTCFKLTHRLLVQLKKDPANYNTFTRVQMPALNMFANTVEKYGINIDTDCLDNLQKSLNTQQESLYNSLISRVSSKVKRKHLDAGKELKFSRSAFVSDVLFSKDGLNLTPKVFTNSTKNLPLKDRLPSTSAGDHLPYFSDVPFVNDLIQYKKLQKMVSTYVGDRKQNTGFWQYIHKGKIHPTYNLHRVVTGRTSSSDPNGQNFPKRGQLAKDYRKIFVAPKGYVIVSADLSQAELRLVAWQANERNMLKIYNSGGDIHSNTASSNMKISLSDFNKLDEEQKKLSRHKAKAVNFGFIYGMWHTKFMVYAKTDYGLEYTTQEAKDTRQQFFNTYPGLLPWHERMRKIVHRDKQVKSLHGATRRLPNISSSEEYIVKECERQAINSPIQRFASDISLLGAIRLVRDADPNIIRPICFVHDQLVTLVKEDYAEEAPCWLKFYMESVPYERWFGIKPPLPLLADAEISISNLCDVKELPNIKAKAPDWYNEVADN